MKFKFSKLGLQMYRKQFVGLGVLGLLIIVFQIGIFIYQRNQPVNPIKVEIVEREKSAALTLTDFDPNDLDEQQWRQLGFSDKQVQTILKYKQVVGGAFVSKEQLSKCYAISPEKFAELESYILLPKQVNESQAKEYLKKSFAKKEISVSKPFNPDSFSVADWMNLGFSENQSNAILKYKDYLGGSFISKEKFKACFIISEKNYQKLAPYLLLPDKLQKENTAFTQQAKPKISYSSFDPNALDLDGWQQLGFSEKQAQVILNYKNRNLKGSFKSLDDIKNCFVINSEKFEEMKPYIKLSAAEKPNVQPIAPTDFSKLDINTISYGQLIEFGFDEKAAGSFVGFRKVLGGFVNPQQVLETYHVDKNLAEKLINTLDFETSKVQKYSLVDAPESFLKSHPYFKYSAERILFLRVTYPNQAEIFKRLKLKPEYEAKMKWYLK